MNIKWDLLDNRLVDRYRELTNIEPQSCRWMMLNEKNIGWLDVEKSNTDSFKIFGNEVNRLNLTINLFENLLLFEDIRHESIGKDDFPIDMPREYFRIPAQNNLRDQFSYREFSSKELNKINNIIFEARASLNIRNDENIARELIHRLEFLSLFSYFEAFLERLLGMEIWDGSEDKKKEANQKVMRKNLPDALQFVIGEINKPEILNLITEINASIFNILHFSYLVRNVHTHNLGKSTNYVIEKGLDYGSLVRRPIKDTEGTIIRIEIIPDIKDVAMRPIILGRYISLSILTSLLRSYLVELAYILDISVQQS